MAASTVPSAPPTSTIVRVPSSGREAIAAVLNPPLVRFAIAPVNLLACSGWCDSQAKNGSPYRCSAAGRPVRTAWMSSANGA